MPLLLGVGAQESSGSLAERTRRLAARFGLDRVLAPAPLAHALRDSSPQPLPPARAGDPWITVDLHSSRERPPGADLRSQRERPAFLQLTSGTTGTPRAVAIGEDRLRLHLDALAQVMPAPADVPVLSWLPLHHDMGLVGGLLYPAHVPRPLYLLDPSEFRAAPLRWLELATEVAAGYLVAPASAWSIAARLAPRARRNSIDLSSVRHAMVGAEPVTPRLVSRLLAALGPLGLHPEAIRPVYGLAEATLAVTYPPVGRPPRVLQIDRDAFETEGRVIPGRADAPARGFVSVGAPIPGTELRIVREGDAAAPDVASSERVGAIEVRSKTLMLGLVGEDEDPVAADGWLRTGDEGFLSGGELYVTGRTREIIIQGGRNLDPAAIEELVEGVPGVRAAAALGVRSPTLETERLVVLGESTQIDKQMRRSLVDRIRGVLADAGYEPDELSLVGRGDLLRTTSGKLRRRAMAERRERAENRVLQDIDAAERTAAHTGSAGLATRPGDMAARVRETIAALFEGPDAARYLEEASPLDAATTLDDLGLSSLARVELGLRLEESLGLAPGSLPYLGPATTVEELEGHARSASAPAGRVTTPESPAAASSETASGEDVPFTQLQDAHFRRGDGGMPARAHVLLYLRGAPDTDPGRLQAALDEVAAAHDALRLRFRCGEDGRWRQRVAARVAIPLSVEDSSRVPLAKVREFGSEVARSLGERLDAVDGTRLAAALIERGAREPKTVLLRYDHLAGDATSVAILLASLRSAYQRPGSVRAQPCFAERARALAALAASTEAEPEFLRWRSTLERDAGAGDGTEGERGRRCVVTRGPLHLLAQPVRTAHDAWLAASVHSWCELTGASEAVVEVEHHGRIPLGIDGIAAGADPSASRVVGWLACRFPIRLPATATVEQVRERLDALPHGGLSYGALLASSRGEALRALPPADLAFSYRARMRSAFLASSFLPLLHTATLDDLRQPPPTRPAVDVEVEPGPSGLQLNLVSSVWSEERLEAIADSILRRRRPPA